MADLEKKIDALAQVVTEGFSEMRSEVREGFAEVRKEIDDLAQMTAREFTTIRNEMATKADLEELRGTMEVTFDKQIGVFRKDIDGLASRVKDLEVAGKH